MGTIPYHSYGPTNHHPARALRNVHQGHHRPSPRVAASLHRPSGSRTKKSRANPSRLALWSKPRIRRTPRRIQRPHLPNLPRPTLVKHPPRLAYWFPPLYRTRRLHPRTRPSRPPKISLAQRLQSPRRPRRLLRTPSRASGSAPAAAHVGAYQRMRPLRHKNKIPSLTPRGEVTSSLGLQDARG